MRTRVLIVDDEPQAIEALRDLLRKEDFDIRGCHSAREALSLLASHPVDVVLSDECMPGMTGMQFLAAVAQDYPETVRMIITGKAKLESALDALNDGVIQRFLAKPCPPHELVAGIREGLRRRAVSPVDPRMRLNEYNRPAAAAPRGERPARDAEARNADFSFRGFVEVNSVYRMIVEAQRRRRSATSVTAFNVDCFDTEGFSPFALAELLRAAREFETEGVTLRLNGTPPEIADWMQQISHSVLLG